MMILRHLKGFPKMWKSNLWLVHHRAEAPSLQIRLKTEHRHETTLWSTLGVPA